MSFRKFSKENFGAGSVSLYLNADNESSMINYLSKDREIEGKVLLKIMIPTFLKGIWVKILGSITINYPDNSKLNQYNINTFDLFKESDEYYLDGLHEVLLGFGEEDNNYGSLVDIKPGRYQYPFLFKLPFNAPASYFDTNVNISYKIIVMLEYPSVSNRIAMENEIIIPGCSQLYCLKLREDVALKRDVLKVGKQLYKQNNQSFYFFPTILNIIRTPVHFNVTLKSITEDSQRTSSNNILSPNNSQDLNFENKKLLLEFECSIQNLRLRNPILVKCDLYSEICINSSPTENFPVSYPLSSNNRNYDKHNFIHHISESNQIISCENFNNFCVRFPIEISTEPYFSSLKSNSNTPTRLLSQLFKHPENKGKILHYTIENPLFRIRILLKISLLKQTKIFDKYQELASTFGEIFISPPFADNIVTSTSNNIKNDIRSFPRASINDTERTIPLNYNHNSNTGNNNTDSQSFPHQDNTRHEVFSSRIPLQDRNLLAARPTSGIRSSRNVGGVASFRSQHINNLDTENAYNHINILPTASNIIINTNKTPHARPSKSKRVITVQAESLSRGPAAAVIDRQDRSMHNNSIATPQRFAMMYEMCSASVLDGSPIVCASTPVTLSTVDFNRIREQNNNQIMYSFGSTLNINTPISNHPTTQENRQDTQYDVADLLLYNNNQSSDITYLNSVPNTSRSSTSTDENTSQELSIIL